MSAANVKALNGSLKKRESLETFLVIFDKKKIEYVTI